MNLTSSQQSAVEHRGASLLVSASAGSGKTEVLARRVAALLADPQAPCHVDQLLVVTFTRAAAAELRVRVGRMLREKAACVRDRKLREHLLRQQVLLDAADIGTIDAWCSRVLRAHSAAVGVDPGFSVLAEPDALLLRREVAEELFRWIYEADDDLAAAARDWLRRRQRVEDEFLRRHVLELNSFREHVIDVDVWFARQRSIVAQSPEGVRADARRLLAGAMRDECLFVQQNFGALRGRASAAVRTLLDALHEALGDAADALTAPAISREALLCVGEALQNLRCKAPRGAPDADKVLLEEIRKRWLERRLLKSFDPETLQHVLDTAPQAAALLRTLFDLEARFQQMLVERKRAMRALEFGEVLRCTLDLLGGHDMASDSPASGIRRPTEVAEKLRARYAHVLVDEYQDTSPVQVEILRLVSREAPGESNRFLVGDVKQSIYGFRQAEPRLFVELLQRLQRGAEAGRVQFLSDNFRSHADIVAGLNNLFAALFDARLGGTGFGPDERLSAQRGEITNRTLEQGPRITIQVLEQANGADFEAAEAEDDADEVPLQRMEREATLVAEEIQRMRRADVQIPARSPDGALALRPLQFSDVAILLRAARQNAAVVAGMLRRCGIPCRTGGRDLLLDVPEVMDVYNVLSLIANRRQDVPLAGYLRGPLVGLSAAELLEIRRAASTGDFWRAVMCFSGWEDDERGDPPASLPHVDVSRPLQQRVSDALQQLAYWRRLAREIELPDLLRVILHEGGLMRFAAGLINGEHRTAMLRALERFAADFAGQGQHGVGEFVAYLEALTREELEPGLPVAAGEDAVRIMTIHAAKGLEFPVVFLLNAGGRFNQRRASNDLQCDPEGGVGLRFLDYPARQKLIAAQHLLNARRSRERDLEEELRLLYVATTRARERLIIMSHAKPEAWVKAQQAYGGQAAPPLASRLAAGCFIDWLLMATAASGSAAAVGDKQTPLIEVRCRPAEDVQMPDAPAPAAAPAAEAESEEDRAWVRAALRYLTAPLPLERVHTPAVVSVSAAKRMVSDSLTDEADEIFTMSARAALPPPRFVAADAADGRAVGVATHRFLQYADLRDLAAADAVRRQAAQLQALGRLSAEERELLPVDDIAWFAETSLGRLAAEHAPNARRELPFIHALGSGSEAPLVRGVIDCLLQTPEGLVLLDYKTDAVSGDELTARIALYEVQMQLYAAATAAIFAAPVREATLVFLRARQLVSVALDAPALVLARFEALLVLPFSVASPKPAFASPAERTSRSNEAPPGQQMLLFDAP